jgi:hypothetical protein
MTPEEASERARLPTGSSPGRNSATRQREPSAAKRPPLSAGRSPARTSEDLPQPDAPTTARSRLWRNSRTSSSISPSRPKKNLASRGPKGRRPGKGTGRASAGGGTSNLLSVIMCGHLPHPEATFGEFPGMVDMMQKVVRGNATLISRIKGVAAASSRRRCFAPDAEPTHSMSRR